VAVDAGHGLVAPAVGEAARNDVEVCLRIEANHPRRRFRRPRLLDGILNDEVAGGDTESIGGTLSILGQPPMLGGGDVGHHVSAHGSLAKDVHCQAPSRNQRQRHTDDRISVLLGARQVHRAERQLGRPAGRPAKPHRPRLVT
jgi:hypothetical protein